MSAETHDRYEPRLRVRASGLGGSGYKLPTRDFLVVPGITTVLGVLEKPAVTQWAVNQTAAWAVHNIDGLLNRTEDQGFNMLRWYWKRQPDFDDPTVDIRDVHHGVLMDAAELGTLMHDWIADDINDNFPPDLVRWEQDAMVRVWLEWKDQHQVEVLLTESTVVGDGYAGTLDHIWKIGCLHGGEPCVPGMYDNLIPTMVDVKTSRSTQPVHYSQLAALGAADGLMIEVDSTHPDAVEYETKQWGKTYWIEDVPPAFSQYAILQVRPDDVDHQGTPVPAFAKLKHVPHELVSPAYDMFRGALAARHAQAAMKPLLKQFGL